ncbi:MAG: hypothetical protein U0Q07_10820 [Acidimicrobiales bacterium]
MSSLTPTLARVVPGLTVWSVLIALVGIGMAAFFVVIAVSLRERRAAALDAGARGRAAADDTSRAAHRAEPVPSDDARHPPHQTPARGPR